MRGPSACPACLLAAPPRTSTRPPPFRHTAPCPYNLMLVRCRPFLLQDIPHLPGSNGDIDVADADMRKRIDNRVHDGLGCAHGGRFTDTFGSDGMMRRRGYGSIGLPVRRLHRSGNQVVLEVAAEDVAVLVVRQLLVHRGGKPLG